MKTKKFKKTETIELIEEEFKLLCDAKNGTLLDFTEPFFKKHFIAGLIDAISYRSLNNKWKVDAGTLIFKLCDMNEKEILELQNKVDAFWEIDDRHYARFGYKSPEYLLKTLYHVPISSN